MTSYNDIPVPTSYMVVDSAYGFLGGYDYRANGGLVYVADPLMAPGKKQWTWGHAAFGRAWDRELCDDGAPYLELMGGVYTDNQPDFSYLGPYETKNFSQFWWPIQGIGPVVNANRDAAIRFAPVENSQPRGFEDEDENEGPHEHNAWEACLVAPRQIENERLIIQNSSGSSKEVVTLTLDPGHPWRTEFTLPPKIEVRVIKLVDQNGRILLSFKPEPGHPSNSLPEPAREPKQPAELPSGDQLFMP